MSLILLAGGVLWLGSIRQPADLRQPPALNGVPRLGALSQKTVKIGVFNIHGCKGNDGVRDLQRVAACLHGLDFVSLHEVRGGYGSNQAYELGRLSDRAALFAPTEWRWGRNDFGNGLLTNVALQGIHQIPLAMTKHTYRNALLTSFQFGAQIVQVLIVHIDLMQDRQRQTVAITNLFSSLKSPAILMGDLNVNADDSHIRKLLAQPGVHNAFANTPGHSRDWIITKGLTTVSATVDHNNASDHPLIYAELMLDTNTTGDTSPKTHSVSHGQSATSLK